MTLHYLHVVRSLDPRGGGVATGVRQLSAAGVRKQQHVEIVTLDAPGSPWSREQGCPVHALGPAHLNYGYAPRLVQWLRANVERFHAVIVDGIWQYHSFATWQVLRGHPTVPYYVFTHGMLDPWFKEHYPLRHIKKRMYWPWAEYRVLRDAQAVLFTSEEERLLARQSFPRYRANEIVVGYGTDAPTGDPRMQRELFLQRFPALRDRRVLLFLGRIHPKKGCDLLIEAFAAVARTDPALHLVIAGPDQLGLQPSLAAAARHHGIEAAIAFPGMLDGDTKWGALHAAEAFVLPSHQENFGIAVVEALACGVPVLISNKVNIWREILADRAGLVAPDTAQGTLQLLQRWLAFTAAERELMASNAAQCFRSRFEMNATAERLIAVLGR